MSGIGIKSGMMKGVFTESHYEALHNGIQSLEWWW
jgi:hypothetical protein